MREHVSITIQRMLTLRQLPGFDDADLSELATLAENVVERRFAAGATVAAPASRLPSIHLICEGRLAEISSGRAWGPRQLFGALEAMAGRAVRGRVVAVSETRTLQLAAADFIEILEDNHGVLSSARRTLARRLIAQGAAPGGALPAGAGALAEPLGIVDRLAILRAQPPFAEVSLQGLATLAQATEELRILARSPICRAGEDARGIFVILDGVARASRANGPGVLAAGAACGALEVLAERPHASGVESVTAARVLRVPDAALLDVMEDHTDFAVALLGWLAGALLDLARPPGEVN